MDEKEAKEIVNNFIRWNQDGRWLAKDKMEEFVNTLNNALDKQIAMSRVIIEGKYFCPKCKNLMKFPGYCGCGQKVY